MATRDRASSGHFHAVRFYSDADALCEIVAGFLTEGYKNAQPGIVIATAEHRAIIERCLGARGLDVARLQREGLLFLLDAEETLGLFMMDGVPDPVQFRRAILPLIEQAAGGRKDIVVRAYGEMVDVLWKAGHAAAAIRLETLWNDLARTKAFSLLCGYAMGNFYKDSAVEEICSHHSHVVSSSGSSAVAY